MKNKKFDCVEMKRFSQENIYSEIKDMSKEDELKYWHNAENKLHLIIKKTIKKSAVH